METFSLTIAERLALLRMLNELTSPRPLDEVRKIFKIMDKIDFTPEEKAMKQVDLDEAPALAVELSTEQATFVRSTFEKQKDKITLNLGRGVVSLADKLGYGDTTKE